MPLLRNFIRRVLYYLAHLAQESGTGLFPWFHHNIHAQIDVLLELFVPEFGLDQIEHAVWVVGVENRGGAGVCEP